MITNDTPSIFALKDVKLCTAVSLGKLLGTCDSHQGSSTLHTVDTVPLFRRVLLRCSRFLSYQVHIIY